MVEIIGVRFKPGGKQYYFAPGGLKVQAGQGVIVETARGQEYAECVRPNTTVDDPAKPLRPVVRLASERDMENVARGKVREQAAAEHCQARIAEYGLEMKLVDVEYSLEGNKLLFFFTAEERVDFRALVRDLAAQLHARIEMRQIGVRDEARMLGGLGICGKPFCCATFLDDFHPVSIKMAKTQNLPLNPTKISGSCGRLMCCLKYEQTAYEDAVRRCPKAESFVETPDGVGTVASVDLLHETVRVRLDESTEGPKTYRNSEIAIVRNGKGKRPEGYVPPPRAELEARRYIPEPTEQESKSPPPDALSAALADIFAATDAPPPERKRQQEGGNRRSRNRGGAARQGDRLKPAPEQSKQAPRKQAQSPQPPQAEQAGQAGEKKRPRRPWRPRGGKGGGGQKPQG